jgi:hypothetical protein
MEKPPLLGIKYGDATINEDGYMMIWYTMAYDGMLWIMIYGHYHGRLWYYDGTMWGPQWCLLVYNPHQLVRYIYHKSYLLKLFAPTELYRLGAPLCRERGQRSKDGDFTKHRDSRLIPRLVSGL